jgi:hypothetical protein
MIENDRELIDLPWNEKFNNKNPLNESKQESIDMIKANGGK